MSKLMFETACHFVLVLGASAASNWGQRTRIALKSNVAAWNVIAGVEIGLVTWARICVKGPRQTRLKRERADGDVERNLFVEPSPTCRNLCLAILERIND